MRQLLGVTCLLLAACQGAEPLDTSFHEVTPGACVSLSSYEVTARGAIGQGTELSLTVSNACDDALPVAVTLVDLHGDLNGAFTLIEAPSTVPAGGAETVRVRFEARDDIIHLAELMVVSDDLVRPLQVATLYGLATGGDDLRAGAAPTADAGPNSTDVVTGAPVALDGSGSTDPEGDALLYSWTFKSLPAGSALTNADITDATSVSAGFTPDVDGTYRLRLVVSDGTSVDKDFADFVAAGEPPANTVPDADAGADASTWVGQSVVLDGSGSSDADGDALSYEWLLHIAPADSALTDADLVDADTPQVLFTPDVEGTFYLKLRVCDAERCGKDFVVITAETGCVASYLVEHAWVSETHEGFEADVDFTWYGAAITDWTAAFSFSGDEVITDGWKGDFTQDGADVTVTSRPYNSEQDPGGAFEIGFIAYFSVEHVAPEALSLNGVACLLE